MQGRNSQVGSVGRQMESGGPGVQGPTTQLPGRLIHSTILRTGRGPERLRRGDDKRSRSPARCKARGVRSMRCETTDITKGDVKGAACRNKGGLTKIACEGVGREGDERRRTGTTRRTVRRKTRDKGGLVGLGPRRTTLTGRGNGQRIGTTPEIMGMSNLSRRGVGARTSVRGRRVRGDLRTVRGTETTRVTEGSTRTSTRDKGTILRMAKGNSGLSMRKVATTVRGKMMTLRGVKG